MMGVGARGKQQPEQIVKFSGIEEGALDQPTHRAWLLLRPSAWEHHV